MKIKVSLFHLDQCADAHHSENDTDADYSEDDDADANHSEDADDDDYDHSD